MSVCPRSIEKRPTRLRLEIENERHSKCNRLYLFPLCVISESVKKNDFPNILIYHKFANDTKKWKIKFFGQDVSIVGLCVCVCVCVRWCLYWSGWDQSFVFVSSFVCLVVFVCFFVQPNTQKNRVGDCVCFFVLVEKTGPSWLCVRLALCVCVCTGHVGINLLW